MEPADRRGPKANSSRKVHSHREHEGSPVPWGPSAAMPGIKPGGAREDGLRGADQPRALWKDEVPESPYFPPGADESPPCIVGSLGAWHSPRSSRRVHRRSGGRQGLAKLFQRARAWSAPKVHRPNPPVLSAGWNLPPSHATANRCHAKARPLNVQRSPLNDEWAPSHPTAMRLPACRLRDPDY